MRLAWLTLAMCWHLKDLCLLGDSLVFPAVHNSDALRQRNTFPSFWGVPVSSTIQGPNRLSLCNTVSVNWPIA
jgi:hypothetical protein